MKFVATFLDMKVIILPFKFIFYRAQEAPELDRSSSNHNDCNDNVCHHHIHLGAVTDVLL